MPRHVLFVYRCPFDVSDPDSKYQSKDLKVAKEIANMGLGLFGHDKCFYDVRAKHTIVFIPPKESCIIADCKYEPGTPETKKTREKIEEIIMKEYGITRDKLDQHLTELTVTG